MSNKSYIKTFASVESAKKNLLSRQRISLVNYKLPKEQQKMNKEIFKKNLSPFQLVSKIKIPADKLETAVAEKTTKSLNP